MYGFIEYQAMRVYLRHAKDSISQVQLSTLEVIEELLYIKRKLYSEQCYAA